MPDDPASVRRKKRVRSARHRRHRYLTWRVAALTGAGIALIALALLLLAYGPSTYNAWRQSKLLNRAEEKLRHDEFDAAEEAAQDALKIQPNSLRAFYVLAEATEKQNRPETVAWRAQIARSSAHDPDSQLNLASAALRFGQLDTARHALEAIPPEFRERASYHVVSGWLARSQGDEAGVEQHFAAARDKEPANDLYQYNLAVVRIKSAISAKRDEARETLERLTKSAPYRAGALRALLSDAIQRDDLDAADRFAQELQMSTQVTFSDYLLCLSFYRKLDEHKFDALLDKVKPVAARNPGDLGLLLTWMNNNGLSSELLKWVEKLPVEQTTVPPPAIAVAEAYVAAKNWSRLKRWTRSGSWNDSDYLRFGYQAFAARQLRVSGADAEFESRWRAAERAAFDQPEREINLARLASRWNFGIEAEQLWLRVAKNPPTRREALDALAAIYRANNDLTNLYRTLQRLHESSPQEPVAAANVARLALMLDQSTAEGHKLAKAAYDQAPDDLTCVVTYALSLYGLGRTSDGVEVMKKLSAEQLHEPHVAAYMAVLLLDDNQPEPAKEFVDAARAGSIYSEEKKLLDETLGKVNAQGSPGATRPPAPAESPSPR